MTDYQPASFFNQTELSYRRTAVEGASTIGLTIALYDTLAGDLRRATQALRGGDIDGRCRELNHAAVVLGYLETWIDAANGEPLAGSLNLFYSHLRAKMLEAQIKQSPEIMEEQMRLVLQVRGAWHHLDQGVPTPVGDIGVENTLGALMPFPEHTLPEERVVCRWSA